MRTEEFDVVRRRLGKWTDYKRTTFFVWLKQYYRLDTVDAIRRWLKHPFTTFQDFSNVVATFEALHCCGPIQSDYVTLKQHRTYNSVRAKTLRG